MAKPSLQSLLILLSLFSTLAPVEPSSMAKNSQKRAFIEASCKTTRYPDLCLRCLAKFANTNYTIETPQQLAHVALSVSLSRSLYTRAYLLKVAKEFKAVKNGIEYQIIQDCLRQINDSVDQLGLSIKELRRLNRNSNVDDVLWHISNVETWVSTALTDASTCVGSFPGHRMSKTKAAIKVKALNVAQVTSNALALFHKYATRYRAAARAARKP
ncbi:hypothetical protein L6164_003675 [Bauhinia variegata]|uniref:Uncharacterized protein n=1 Tax=Bauhinia variegata TaxID=167791 RepID=A0ACB9Q422_BAUVA|nr:hypothetical protein L6164_003675 [Bauhinia variegata]